MTYPCWLTWASKESWSRTRGADWVIDPFHALGEVVPTYIYIMAGVAAPRASASRQVSRAVWRRQGGH